MEFRRITNLPPVRLHDHQQPEDGRSSSRRGRHRPRLRQPGHPVARDRGREAGRGRSHRPQPPVLDEPGPAQPPRSPLAALYERKWGVDARPRDRDHQHDRLEGGLQPPDVGAAAVRRRRHRAEPQLPDPHLRPAVRRGRPAPGADAHRRRLLRGPRDGVDGRLAEAAGADHLVPAQPDRRLRRPRVHAARRRLLPRARDDRGARLRLRRPRLRRLRAARRSSRPRAPRSARSSCTR